MGLDKNSNIITKDMNFFERLRYAFFHKKVVQEGQVGIYKYIWTCDTINEDSHGLSYDVFAKVKAIKIYENLIEIEKLDLKITDSASIDITHIIQNNFPKYVNPRYVRWEIIQKK